MAEMTESTYIENDEIRLIVKSLGISCDALLRKIDRQGKQPELIEEYEKMDTLLIKFRLELLERVRNR